MNAIPQHTNCLGRNIRMDLGKKISLFLLPVAHFFQPVQKLFSPLFFFVALVCCPFLVKGQEAEASIGTDSLVLLHPENLWSILEYDESFMPDHLHPTLKTTWLKVEGVAIFNSLEYQIIWSATDEAHENWKVDHFMREDNGKVYQYNNDLPERLLYDFTLNEMDTFHFFRDLYPLVTQVDSIRDTLINNLETRVFYVSTYREADPGWAYPEIWIEGIGSNLGLSRKSGTFLTGNYKINLLNCFSQSGIQLYQSPKYEKCYYNEIVMGNKDDKPNAGIQVYPNPSRGKFTVQIGEVLDDYCLKIFDLNGRLIGSKATKQSTKTMIDLQGKEPGIYILQIENEKYFAIEKLVLR